MADALTAIPAASKAFAAANPNATVAQQVAAGVVKQASAAPTTSPLPQATSTPTVVTDANIREKTIPDTTSRATAALANVGGVIQGAAPDGSMQSANGNYVDKAGNQYLSPPAAVGTTNTTKPATTPAAGSTSSSGASSSSTSTPAPDNDYDAFLKSIFDSNPSTGTTGVAPANDPYMTTLATMRATSDAASKTLIDATMQQFASRKAQLGATQAAQHAGLMQALISSGNARYAPILAGQTMTADETAGVLALSSIDAEQSSAVAQLQKAQADQDFQIMGKALDHLDTLQTQKITVASKLAENAAAATKALNTAAAKVQSDKNKVMEDAVKGGATPEQLAAISAAPDAQGAILAAGSSLQVATGEVGEFLATNRYLATIGQQPLTLKEYQNQSDARKEAIAAASRAPASDKPPTATQVTYGNYAPRIETAGNTIDALTPKLSSMSQVVFRAQQSLPSWAQSSDVQVYNQAKTNFINAVLRQESGAAISDSERASYDAQYFPQPGDSQEVIDSKAQNRAQVIGSYKNAAGPAYAPPIGAVNNSSNADSGETILSEYKTNHPDKVAKMADDISTLEKTLGRPATAAEFLQAYPEYGK